MSRIELGSVWTALSSAGIGSALGYVGAAMIEARSHKRTKTDDAGALVTAATQLTDRLLTRNSELAHTNSQLRVALNALMTAVQLAQNTLHDLGEGVCDDCSSRQLMVVLDQALTAAEGIAV